jgi:Cu-Zn family superoxide dismutase
MRFITLPPHFAARHGRADGSSYLSLALIRSEREEPMKQFLLGGIAAMALAACSPPANETVPPPAAEPPPVAQSLRVDLQRATDQGPGESVGYVEISESPAGAMFAVHLTGMTPGAHGFHVHQNGSCAPGPGADGATIPAGAAGGHFDPAQTGKHLGPNGEGHLGDLPLVEANAEGAIETSVTAPRITQIAQLHGLALMLHAHGDNYSDQPAPLGGGGARAACGVIP